MQIIINRIALLILDQHRVRNLKWIVAIILGFINVSVFCIWIPARLQISERIIFINEIWDRIEKVIFLGVDAGLSCYFIYLVRSKLIANGRTKYMVLFKFNIVMVAVSLSLDVSASISQEVMWLTPTAQIALIGVMSLPNGFVYGNPRCLVSHATSFWGKACPPAPLSDNGIVTFNSTPLSIF